jgi:hypothetical protein
VNTNTLAFVDFLRENPDAMEQVGSVQRGIEILNELAQTYPVSRLVPMTQNSLFGDRLLLHLNSLTAGKKDAQEFYRTVAGYSKEFVRNSVWEPSTVVNVLAEAEFEDLYKHCPDLLDEYHPMHDRFNLDQYWERRVRRYFVRGDYRRTWDELNKARRGFSTQEQAQKHTITRKTPWPRYVGKVSFEYRPSNVL